MFTMQKSALFMQQWRHHAQDYKDRADMATAERFIVAVEEALHFIGQSPYACSIYDPGEGYEGLALHQFRKWSLRGFPHVVFFRLNDNATITVEVLYAHKMDIPSHLTTDMDKP